MKDIHTYIHTYIHTHTQVNELIRFFKAQDMKDISGAKHPKRRASLIEEVDEWDVKEELTAHDLENLFK
jgi:hypothetical protein